MGGLDTEPPCPLATFGPLGACLETHGCISGSTVAEALECVMLNCKTELLAVSQECWACFVTSVEQNNPTAPIGRYNISTFVHEHCLQECIKKVKVSEV